MTVRNQITWIKGSILRVSKLSDKQAYNEISQTLNETIKSIEKWVKFQSLESR